MLWIRQTNDLELEVVHKLLGVVAKDMTMDTASQFIDRWPSSFFDKEWAKMEHAVDNEVILLVNEVTQ